MEEKLDKNFIKKQNLKIKWDRNGYWILSRIYWVRRKNNHKRKKV